jgi:DNA-binding PadR family transcriptional regulator
MSIRFGLLAMFADGPKYGYQARALFETRTGSTWPVNVGQAYTTLERLERDGLVAAQGADDEGRAVYAITQDGRVALKRWFDTPIAPSGQPRDELAIKLLMAATLEGVDVPAVVQRQRNRSMRLLRDCTALRREADATEDAAGLLLLDRMIFALEGDVRWLDHVEATVLRRGGRLSAPQRPRRGARSPASGSATGARR